MKSIKIICSTLIVGVFLFFAFGSGESKKSASNCDVNDEEYKAGYEHGKINKDGGSSVCDPYKDNKVEGHEGYVNTGETIRPVRSDCFCKGFQDGYNGK